MADSQYAPLTAAIVRTLTDKLYEKRKAAALDIEKQVRELLQANHLAQIEKLLTVLKDLTMSRNAHARTGGLIGLAAAAIGLGKNTSEYTSQLIEPVLTCFNDPDSRVRYYACESSYNIIKMCRGSSLSHFDELFETLWRLSADSDLNVRSGSELLDRLLKDIVVASTTFDVAQLMVLVRERIYAQNSSNRKFIVSWLSTMLMAPQMSIVPYLPEVLDGLFQMLSDGQPGVRDATETVLAQFLERLEQGQPEDEVNLRDLVNVLIVHATREGTLLTRKTALIWLSRFIELGSTHLLPYLSAYLIAVLPYLGDDQLKANEINTRLMALFTEDTEVKIDAVIEVLLTHIKHERRETRMAVLNWIRHLHKNAPAKIFPYMDRIFPTLLSMLSDTCDDVLLLDLQLLSDVCEEKSTTLVDIEELHLDAHTKQQLSNISPYLIKFAVSLLKMFRDDASLLSDRGVLIIRQLCLLLDPSHIYRCLSVLLMREENVEFVSQMVAMLNGILLTATELFEMRDQLKALQTEEYISLFECLYRSWAYQPIALLGLCILSQNYQHASQLAGYLWRLDITADVLIEIDRLVQLIESPILACKLLSLKCYVRLDLLSAEHQRPLASVLSALLMLLPQTDGFNTLHKRLQCIPSLTLLDAPPKRASRSNIDFADLLGHFHKICEQQRKSIREKHRQLLIASAQ